MKIKTSVKAGKITFTPIPILHPIDPGHPQIALGRGRPNFGERDFAPLRPDIDTRPTALIVRPAGPRARAPLPLTSRPAPARGAVRGILPA